MAIGTINRSHGHIQDIWNRVINENLGGEVSLGGMSICLSQPLASSAEIGIKDRVSMDTLELTDKTDEELVVILRGRLVYTLTCLRNRLSTRIDDFQNRENSNEGIK